MRFFLIFSLLFLTKLLFAQDVCAQDVNYPTGIREKVRVNSLGIGLQSLGLTEFNQVFHSVGLATLPSLRYALYFSHWAYPEGTKVFTGYSISAQNYFVTNEVPGQISYNFNKQNLDFNFGAFVFENDLMMVPLYGGAGLSFLIFNAHTNFNNDGKDFSQVLLEGSGTGIYNLSEISLAGSLVSGIDIKTSYFGRDGGKKNNMNIGLRAGFNFAAFQFTAGMPGVSGIPQTDRLNYFISLNLIRLITPCP